MGRAVGVSATATPTPTSSGQSRQTGAVQIEGLGDVGPYVEGPPVAGHAQHRGQRRRAGARAAPARARPGCGRGRPGSPRDGPPRRRSAGPTSTAGSRSGPGGHRPEAHRCSRPGSWRWPSASAASAGGTLRSVRTSGAGHGRPRDARSGWNHLVEPVEHARECRHLAPAVGPHPAARPVDHPLRTGRLHHLTLPWARLRVWSRSLPAPRGPSGRSAAPHRPVDEEGDQPEHHADGQQQARDRRTAAGRGRSTGPTR